MGLNAEPSSMGCTRTPKKKLVYVLNCVREDDTQHYVHILALLTKLKELGWSVAVISEKGGIGTRHVLGHRVRYLSKYGGFDRLVALAYELIKLRRQGYCLVFVRISRPAILTAALLGRIIGQQTLFWLSSANQDLDQNQVWLKRLLYNATMASILRLINRFVTGPETMAAYFKATLRVPDRKMMVLYNDIDLSRFAPPAEPNGNRQITRILFVHSLSPNKEASRYFPHIIHCLSRVATKNRPIDFCVVGDGPERELLENIAAGAGKHLSVQFLGGIPNTQIMAHYAAADIFIMPSYREGFPRVIIEAMAMGLPIVTTDAGGTRDLLGQKQQDYIVSRDDPAKFASLVAELIVNCEKQRELAEENLARVRLYSTDNVARMFDEKLSRVLRGASDSW